MDTPFCQTTGLITVSVLSTWLPITTPLLLILATPPRPSPPPRTEKPRSIMLPVGPFGTLGVQRKASKSFGQAAPGFRKEPTTAPLSLIPVASLLLDAIPRVLVSSTTCP